MSVGSGERVFDRARSFNDAIATVDAGGTTRYSTLLAASQRVAGTLLVDRTDLEESRIAFIEPPGAGWVAVQWGIWRAGGIAVPLALSHPAREIEQVLDDAAPAAVIAHSSFAERVRALALDRGIRLLSSDAPVSGDDARISERGEQRLPSIPGGRRAMMLYTSGTTGRPKGVVFTHANISAQIETLVRAWGWSAADRILHVLPLHHVHGIINVLSCALWSGASCEFLLRFEAGLVWDRLASGHITCFMAVPTTYHRLVAAWEAAPAATRDAWSAGSRRLRLMVSGSAALPVRTLERWREITGHTLLERYGMTEIGMALSNPLTGERRAGTVGQPLPGVDARIVDDLGLPVDAGTPGQIEVRGRQVFLEYWQRPDETARAFHDDWFMTGDEAVIEDGYWRILGRRSVDIIKSGGYKLSALEIEDALREHDGVADCAVVGVPDDDLGERVAVAIIAGSDLDGETLRAWARERIAPYKVPRDIVFVNELPRNAMGKVTKPAVRALFDRD